MMETLMATRPKSGDRRELFLPCDLDEKLEKSAERQYTSVTSVILRALEQFVATAYDVSLRSFIGKKEIRRPVNVPDGIWNALKQRKAETGLDLNEQVQIAVALYLQEENTPTTTPDVKPKPTPPTEEEEARLEHLVGERVRATLREELAAMGYEVRPAVPALMQITRTVPVTVTVSCGVGDEVDNIVEPLEIGATADITGRLAEKVTPHSFIARADGWSMKNEESPFDIRPGDLLLMTPRDEYPGTIKKGAIVLARVHFKDGRVVQTLKSYEGRTLKANNPAFKDIGLGSNVKRAEVIAVCRGVLEKVFD